MTDDPARAQTKVHRVETLGEGGLCDENAIRVPRTGHDADGVRSDLDGVSHADEDSANDSNNAGMQLENRRTRNLIDLAYRIKNCINVVVRWWIVR